MTWPKALKIFGVLVLLVGMAMVRFLQDYLFYDPLDEYFHQDFQNLPFPELNLVLLVASNALRYLINAMLALGVLWLLFGSRSYIVASAWVYLFAFIILNALFLVAFQFDEALAKMVLFYTRRFIIHPILFFVLVAGGYFLHQSKTTTKDSNEPLDSK